MINTPSKDSTTPFLNFVSQGNSTAATNTIIVVNNLFNAIVIHWTNRLSDLNDITRSFLI